MVSVSTRLLTLACKSWISLKRLRWQSLGQGSVLLEMSPRVKNKKVGKIYYRDFHVRGDVISHHRYTWAYIKPDKLELKETFQRRRHCGSMSLASSQLLYELKVGLTRKSHNVSLPYKYRCLRAASLPSSGEDSPSSGSSLGLHFYIISSTLFSMVYQEMLHPVHLP